MKIREFVLILFFGFFVSFSNGKEVCFDDIKESKVQDKYIFEVVGGVCW
jgi:hypothetical protein